MESFVLVSSVILIAIVAFYTWITYRSLQITRQENSLYRAVIEQHLKQSVLPHLYCDLHSEPANGGLKLEMYNIGNVPTYDVLISWVGAYTEEGIDIPTFLRTYVQPRYRKYPLQADKVGYYGVRNMIRSPLLATQKRLAIAITLPTQPVDIYALIQYRDLAGSNYYQVYCFSDIDEKGNYRANVLEPQRFEPIERLHFYDMDDAKLPLPELAVPYYVNDFVELWNHSLSYRLTTIYSDTVPLLQDVQDVS